MSVDDAFGYWLAGFFDGEGSVGIYEGSRGNGWRCTAKISLRADDAPILDEIARRTGIGDVFGDRKGRRDGGNPCASWHVSRKADCLALVELFERYPLRAKKARDVRIWSAAVRAWCMIDHRGGKRVADWTRVKELRADLNRLRAFGAEDTSCAQGRLL